MASAFLLAGRAVVFYVLLGQIAFSSVHGQLPPNDACSGAIPVAAGERFIVNITADTTDSNEGYAAAGRNVWFRFSTETAGIVTLTLLSADTSPSDNERITLWVTGYSGLKVDALGCANGTKCCTEFSQEYSGIGQNVKFAASANYSTVVEFAYEGTAIGQGVFEFTVADPPANDNCVDATQVTGTGPHAVVDATETIDGKVWFRWNSSCDGYAQLFTCGVLNPALATLYESGNCSSLSGAIFPEIGRTTAACADSRYYGLWQTTPGAIHFIEAQGQNLATFRIECPGAVDPRPPPPSNDVCDTAIAVAAGERFVVNITADTTDSNEGYAAAGRNVWFRFSTETAGIVTLTLLSADASPSDNERITLWVTGYSGLKVDALGCANGTKCCTEFSQEYSSIGQNVKFAASANYSTVVEFAYEGTAIGQGMFEFTLADPLANDDCAGATGLSGTGLHAVVDATETADGKVWFRWNSSCDGYAQLFTCGVSNPALAMLYESGNCSSLSGAIFPEIGRTTTACADSRYYGLWQTTRGAIHFIEAQGKNNATFRIECAGIVDPRPPPPLNDACGGAITAIAGEPFIANITAETTDSNEGYMSAGRNLWFRFFAETAGTGMLTLISLDPGSRLDDANHVRDFRVTGYSGSKVAAEGCATGTDSCAEFSRYYSSAGQSVNFLAFANYSTIVEFAVDGTSIGSATFNFSFEPSLTTGTMSTGVIAPCGEEPRDGITSGLSSPGTQFAQTTSQDRVTTTTTGQDGTSILIAATGISTAPSSQATSAIAVTVAAALVACCLTLFAVFWVFRRRRQRHDSTSVDSLKEMNKSGHYVHLSVASDNGSVMPRAYGSMNSVGADELVQSSPTYARFDPASLRGSKALKTSDGVLSLDPAMLVTSEELGRGQYGVVFRGKYGSQDVAVKHILADYDAAAMAEFYAEAELMGRIVAHPNVLALVGLVALSRNGRAAIVTEFCAGDSLKSAAECGLIVGNVFWRCTIGIASGMRHLAASSIVHRDLAARNVLLDSDFNPRISDFGLSRLVLIPEEGGVSVANTGPLRWMAPEALSKRLYSEKSDVWMFGCTILEVINNGDPPFANEAPMAAAGGVMLGQRVPTECLPADCSPDIHQVLTECFAFDPADRPTFAHIHNRLQGMAD